MKLFFLVFFLSLITNPAQAGDKGGGNGGGIHYCPLATTIEKAQMYDVYEAFTRYDYNIPQTDEPVEEIVKRALKKVAKQDTFLEAIIFKQVDYLLKGKHLLLRSNIDLTPISDHKILVKNKDCSYEQLANWDEKSGNVMVAKEYYELLDNISKAALILHEAIYKVGRDYFHDESSENTRRIVGEMLSDRIEPLESIEAWYYSNLERSGREDYVHFTTTDAPESFSVTEEAGEILVKYHLGDKRYFLTSGSFKYSIVFPNLDPKSPTLIDITAPKLFRNLVPGTEYNESLRCQTYESSGFCMNERKDGKWSLAFVPTMFETSLDYVVKVSLVVMDKVVSTSIINGKLDRSGKIKVNFELSENPKY
jgi:hypothetical protein